ncbi:MAG: LegC family aminotransferase [bacterium]
MFEIFLDAPSLGEKEKEYLLQAVDTGYVSTFGPFVPRFEEKFAQYVGAKKAVSTQSGTAAIHIALYELGIGKGDEVIVPALTFIATVNPVLYVGARPVIVDVEPETWNIDPEEIRRYITQKTRAIIPVHLYGNPCKMKAIMEIATENNLYVIEDATESLGAVYGNKQTGTFGDLGCFSFNGNKTITTGGGGMVVGNNVERLEHIKFLVNQARDEAGGYYHPEIGFNYRMTNIEAALGLAQMDKLDSFLLTKREFNDIYKEELKGVEAIRFQEEYEEAESSWWLSCVTLEGVDISALQGKLKEKGIPTRRIFMPLVEFPPYKQYKQAAYQNSYHIYDKGLCLPSSTLNSKNDIYYVCKTIEELV